MGKNGWFHNKIILSFYPSLCFFICLSCPSYLSACPNHDQKLNHGTQQCVIRTHYPNLKSNVKIASLTCHVYKRGSTTLLGWVVLFKTGLFWRMRVHLAHVVLVPMWPIAICLSEEDAKCANAKANERFQYCFFAVALLHFRH